MGLKDISDALPLDDQVDPNRKIKIALAATNVIAAIAPLVWTFLVTTQAMANFMATINMGLIFLTAIPICHFLAEDHPL